MSTAVRRLLVAVAVLLAVVGTGGPWAYATFGDTSAKDRIGADPPPALFPDSDLTGVARTIEPQAATAHRLMAAWWRAHGSSPDDAAFLTWVAAQVPPPPAPSARDTEVEDVRRLASHRTPALESAATWLEVHGKKDVWKLAAHDDAEQLSKRRGRDVKDAVDLALTLTRQVADDLGARYQQSAPYVLHPELRPDHTISPGQVCPCSYPSRHASAGAASRTVLALVAPHRHADYRWTEDEVDYSRLYMAGHVPSDLAGGALLGDLVGEYVAGTRLGLLSVATG